MLNPLPAEKWNYMTAAHLLNRTGFGGTPGEIEKLVALGPDKAVAHFVDYEKIPDPTPNPDWAKPDSTRVDRFLAYRKLGDRSRRDMTTEERKAFEEKRREMVRDERRTQQLQLLELRGWWLKRMAHGPRPLQEKLTLFWHGHFATSAQKVRESYYMWLQNQTFRTFASGNWLQMLNSVAKDPAMLMKYNEYRRRMNKNKAIIRIGKHLLSRVRYVWQNQTKYERGIVK